MAHTPVLLGLPDRKENKTVSCLPLGGLQSSERSVSPMGKIHRAVTENNKGTLSGHRSLKEDRGPQFCEGQGGAGL